MTIPEIVAKLLRVPGEMSRQGRVTLEDARVLKKRAWAKKVGWNNLPWEKESVDSRS